MRRRSGYIVLAVAAAIYIFYNFTVTTFIIAELDEKSISILDVFIAELIVFIPVGVFFITIQKLYKTKRWLFTTLSLKTVSVHILLLLSLIGIHAVWQVYFNSVFLGIEFVPFYIIRDVIGFLNLRVLIYIITISLVVGMVKIQEKEKSLLKQSELKLKLQRTSFRELELKLNPEIIYPNLHFIKKNARKKPEETSALILSLSKQLRILIDGMDEERIPLRKDINFYTHYIQALQIRLGRTLHIHSKIDDALLDVEIPSLVLMAPFLEELFFGEYAKHTSKVEQVRYRAKKIELGGMLLELTFTPVCEPEKLGRQIKKDGSLAEIEQLLTVYESSALRTRWTGNSLSITLKMIVS